MGLADAKRKGKYRFYKIVVIVALSSLLFFFRFDLLSYIGVWLVHDDSERLQTGKYIVVLMGDLTSSRGYAAFQVWQRNTEQTIVVMEEHRFGFIKLGLMPTPSSIHKRYFEMLGVPTNKILVINNCDVDSTLDEAVCFYRFAMKEKPIDTKVTIVTSFYHSSRAFWIFSHIFHKIGKSSIQLNMVPAPALDKEVTNGQTPAIAHHLWWQREDLFLAVFNEYLKWLYWTIKGLPRTIESFSDENPSTSLEGQK